ncbi:hypothetical protein BD779DRAFT_1518399 [Infundibulicybe gibba]|nr:hypothetical protein BD779DRAFT_1518399 [Infundibulicybe gibba]
MEIRRDLKAPSRLEAGPGEVGGVEQAGGGENNGSDGDGDDGDEEDKEEEEEEEEEDEDEDEDEEEETDSDDEENDSWMVDDDAEYVTRNVERVLKAIEQETGATKGLLWDNIYVRLRRVVRRGPPHSEHPLAHPPSHGYQTHRHALFLPLPQPILPRYSPGYLPVARPGWPTQEGTQEGKGHTCADMVVPISGPPAGLPSPDTIKQVAPMMDSE